jgi:hypothetical protein
LYSSITPSTPGEKRQTVSSKLFTEILDQKYNLGVLK